MAATKTPTLGSDEASLRYEEALTTLRDSLDNRKRLFDPTMLAFAQGILSPTQTGGFGEALGNAAKSVGAAQEAEDKRNQEMLQAKVAVAGQGVEAARAKANAAAIQEWLKTQAPQEPKPVGGALTQVKPEIPEVPAAPTAPTAPTGALSQVEPPAPPSLPSAPPSPLGAQPAPTAALPAPLATSAGALPDVVKAALPPGNQNVRGRQIMPPNPSFMTRDEFVKMNAGSGLPIGELLAKGSEIERHRFEKNESAIIDKRTGLAYPIKDAMVDVPIYGKGFGGATYTITESEAAELAYLKKIGDHAAYMKAANTATGRDFGATEAGGSKEERAISGESAKERAKAKTAREIEEITNFEQKDRDARDTITVAKQFRKFAEDPASEKMAGILNNDKYSSIVAKAVQSGIGTQRYRIGVPELEDIMRNAGLNKEEQAKYRTFLMLTVESILMKTKYMKGSISNYEDQMLANAGINAQDTPATIRMKADLFTRRAQFDRRAARAFEESGMTAKDFLKSKTYDDMRAKYDEDLAELSFGNKVLAPAPKKSTTGGKDLDAARARVDDILKAK